MRDVAFLLLFCHITPKLGMVVVRGSRRKRREFDPRVGLNVCLICNICSWSGVCIIISDNHDIGYLRMGLWGQSETVVFFYRF